jgi:hypothetical protein
MSLPSGQWEIRLREINAQVEYATTKTRDAGEFEHLSELRNSLQCAITRLEALVRWEKEK